VTEADAARRRQDRWGPTRPRRSPPTSDRSAAPTSTSTPTPTSTPTSTPTVYLGIGAIAAILDSIVATATAVAYDAVNVNFPSLRST